MALPETAASQAPPDFGLEPGLLSKRSSYVKFNDDMEEAMSSQRQLDMLRAPIIVTYGTNKTPEFQRQNRDTVP